MKKTAWYGTDAYLTVFLSLILSIMISLCLVLVLGARENTRRMEIECITDIGMNNILAEYHRELLEQYDLFFIDTSYGTPYASYEKTAEHLKEYIECNLGDEEIFLSFLYRNPVKLQADKVEIMEVSAASDDGGAVLRRQAVDVMYQRIGISYLQQIMNWVEVVKEYDMNTRNIMEEQKKASAALEEWSSNAPEIDGATEKITLPGNKVVSFWETEMLNLVTLSDGEISVKTVDVNAYLSARQRLLGTGMNSAIDFADGFWEQLIFHEYIMAYTGHYGLEKENGTLGYQTEYILAGKGSDMENLKTVVYNLLAIRAVANVIYLVSDKEKMTMAEAMATAIASLLTIPQAAPLFQAVIVLTWAMAESIFDVILLLAGKRVPLLKGGGEWQCTLEEMVDFTGNTDSEKEGSGLCYEDYLRIMLCFQDKETTTYRLMDIMEMDIRQTSGNRYFRMDGCIDSLKAAIQYSAKDGKTYSIVRSYGY